MPITGRAVVWACKVSSSARKITYTGIEYATSGSGMRDYVEAVVKNAGPGHSSTSDARKHATVWLKTIQMQRDNTHRTLHIYFDRNGQYSDHKLYSAVHTDAKPKKSHRCVVM